MQNVITNLDSLYEKDLDNIGIQAFINEGPTISQAFTAINIAEFMSSFADNEKYEVFDFRHVNQNVIIKGRNNTILIHVYASKMIKVFARSHAIIADFVNETKHCLRQTLDNEITIKYFYFQQGIVKDLHIDLSLARLKEPIKELYQNVDIDKLINAYYTSQENVLLLYGRPGVGKTQFIKYLIKSQLYKHIAYVKDTKVMNEGSFWLELSCGETDLIIFDDLDITLDQRNEFTSNLLSYSDGIFSSSTKILITTNQEIHQIDSALLRPGRCFDFIVLEPLTRLQAEEIWANRFALNKDNLFMNNETITQAEFVRQYLEATDKTKVRDYLKNGDKSIEERLSKVGVTFESSKKFGF